MKWGSSVALSRSTGEQNMSVQFGRWNFEGAPPAQDYIEKISAALSPYGPDSNASCAQDGVTILYRAFHTTEESHRETQPHISQSGVVITWDGRLDNRAELISELRDGMTANTTDIAIVSAAYEKWGVNCLGKLIGDWALCIWNPRDRSVLLAKDPIGTHHLFYSIDKDQITWSTILDPLVLFAGKTFALCEEYIAGWFSHFPATHLTPYVCINAVPPSSFVLLKPGKQIVSRYWDFDPGKTIRYRTDAEYEEHFRSVLFTAVQRRLRSDRPVLAELSGGMDSSSIVCMADTVIARGAAEGPGLDTISWYNDADPHNDERYYFTKVEEKRGRSGWHFDLGSIRAAGSQRALPSDFEDGIFAGAPIPNRGTSEFSKQYANLIRSKGYRITLSGLAGESATGGGVPTPIPELQNLLTRGQFGTLARQLKAWADKMRRRKMSLLLEAALGFLPFALRGANEHTPLVDSWLHPCFVRRNHAALCGYSSRVSLFGPLPSFQDNLCKLNAERRLLAFYALPSAVPRDIRYPYVDRNFLEFVFAIPREQIVRVGQRRSLMRRALIGIVPYELLNRKRKTSVLYGSKNDTGTELASQVDVNQPLISGSIGIIDGERFLEALQATRRRAEVLIDALMRTLTLESWLRHLTTREVLTTAISK
jgi:asparagine synthase (glutamine-hydrolysing)